MKAKTLSQQIAESEKKTETLRKKLEAENNKNKPKSIMDRVKNMTDILKIAKPTKEELAIINYKGKSNRLNFAKDFLVLSLISEVLNEGWQPKMDGTKYRYYPYFYLKAVSSGFGFDVSAFVYDYANASSASRLCFKTSELAEFAGKIFTEQYKKAIIG